MDKPVFRTRRKARVLALQALYETDAVGHDGVQVLTRLLEEAGLPEEAAGFAHELVKGVVDHRQEIDRHIKKFAPAWPVSQIPAIDRNILRLAIFEIFIDNRIPVKIGINEAVELAKSFGSDNSPKFINGVLGSVVLELKHNEAVEI
jgi:transcription antitermination protein NusB